MAGSVLWGRKTGPFLANYARKLERIKLSTRDGRSFLYPEAVTGCYHGRWMSTHQSDEKPSVRERVNSQMDKYFGYIKPKKVSTTSRSALKIVSPEGEVIHYRERFIPITRRSIIRHLMQEEGVLTDAERQVFEKFALAIDGALTNRYYGTLEELKSLFDPINPDKDTIATRQWNQKERLDNEFWLLQKLGDVLVRANFHELPKAVVEKAISEHCAGEGIMVSVNPSNYDIMRFWALGLNRPDQKFPWYAVLFYKLIRRPLPQPLEYYRRLISAVRLKKDNTLMLKGYKDIPVGCLEQLLPDATVKMTNLDKSILLGTLAIGVSGIFAKTLLIPAGFGDQWTMIISGLCCLVCLRGWTVYKNRKNRYLAELSQMLYFKNIANNRSLIAVIVDRAEEEILKEMLLTYVFLLINRVPCLTGEVGKGDVPVESEGISTAQLERIIEGWIHFKTGQDIQFDCQDSVEILKSFGILSKENDKLKVTSLEVALQLLPTKQESVIKRPQIDVDIH
ncbi:transmembrane protein 143-like isoform X2 [Lineus longissimus]|uniref:transmembrane protein 143-like isoform X2 n=1 Tax=Lineus longissimus TaxID=88925 RepID=UPI00315CA27C